MKVHGQQRGFIASFLCCFGSWEGKLCMLRDGAKTLTPETLPSSTILDHRWLPSTLTAREKVAPAEGEDHRKPFTNLSFSQI